MIGSSGRPGSSGSPGMPPPPSPSPGSSPGSSPLAPSATSQLLEKPTEACTFPSEERVDIEVPGNGSCFSFGVSPGNCELTWTG